MTENYYDVIVKILEGSHVSGKNRNSQICVQIGDQKRYSKAVYHSNPFFDEYFVFTKFMSHNEFMGTLIKISALEKIRGCKLRKLIGCISIDIATVWSEPGRKLRKWFALSLPSDRSSQKKAFIECEFKISASGESTSVIEFPQQSNMELCEMIGSKAARYKILVYHCIGLHVQTTKKTPKVLIRVVYAGKTANTTRKQLRNSVEWNEQLVFIELFPPMRQRLTVQLCVGKNILAVKNFNFYSFFNIFKGGFLYMFGPTYLHLYAETYLYRGSLLIGIQSEILGALGEFEIFHGVTTKEIEPIPQTKYGTVEQFVCFIICFDIATTSENCGKDDIYVSLEMGNSERVQSKKYQASSSGQNLYVPFGEQKPCFSVRCEWPDCTHRLYNSNLVASLANGLREKLNLSYVLKSRGSDFEAKTLLLSALQKLEKDCRSNLGLLSNGITELDYKRTQFLKKQLNLLVLLLTNNDSHDVFEESEVFLEMLDRCCEDVQEYLPPLLITLRQSETSVGYCLLNSRHLIFSESEEKRGQDSAKIKNFFFKRSGGIVGRIKCWLWLGKKYEINKCKELFPPGYVRFPRTNVDEFTLPYSLTYPNSHTYNVLCHIHSGCTNEEAVNEGQCNSYVKVNFVNQSRRTITAKRTLAPTWKETLILPGVKLYSSAEFLLTNPPSITVQLWDETNDPHTLLGTRLITSTIRLKPLSNLSEFPLQWWPLGRNCEILMSCEIIKTPFKDNSTDVSSILPRLLEPLTISYRLEVVFWGMRSLSAKPLKNILQDQVIIQLSTVELSSNLIASSSTTFNYQHDTRFATLKLPQNKIYSPPLIIKIMSNAKYLASITEKNIYRYECQLPSKTQWEALNLRRTSGTLSTITSAPRGATPDLTPQRGVSGARANQPLSIREIPNAIRNLMRDSIIPKIFQAQDTLEESRDYELEEDWWDRYFQGQIKIYPGTLESQKRFSGFTDIISTFPVKQRNDKSKYSTEICKLKVIINLYKWPSQEPVVTMQGLDPRTGVLNKLSELNRGRMVKILVRVYCVKAIDLYPSDVTGKSDPYIEIATPTKTVSDNDNKILNELNPVFGKSHEIIATLPTDSMLAVRLMDWDSISKNDLIGETIIDIENRFYSKHRCTCGLPETYSKLEPNAWRDIESPTEILERICNTHNLPLPQYHEKSVSIGSKEFVMLNKSSCNKEDIQERLALVALNNWEEMPIVGRPLVGEHVETRFLFREDRPGLVRGKLSMWVDMFDMSLGDVPPPINIAPRTPEQFELRVNILNTAKIPLVDITTLEGKSCTDIMVKGWLGDNEHVQKTDVHYESYNGTGNFNWRFVFPFSYLRKEKKMVFYKKNLFDIGKKEVKVPAVIHLEVYDNEGLLGDACIGGMVLELCQMPKGAQSVKNCAPEKIFNPANLVDLFRVERLCGWWPFLVDNTVMKDTGFLEAEFFLVTAEEAHKSPVGLGRSPPDPLPLPARASGRNNPWIMFLNFINKFNTASFCGYTINIIIVVALIALIGVLIYTLPSTIDKLNFWTSRTF